MRLTRWLALAACAAAILVPALAPGEVVRLKDRSSLQGRLVQVAGDTLTFKTGFGTVKIARSQIVSIVFDDSAAAVVPAQAVPPSTSPGAAVGGRGRIEVVFRDRELSSKIEIDKKKQWDEHVAANHIVVEFIVDGRVVHASADTTMDKRIYQGHTTVMKNEIKLADFGVDVPAGFCHAKLIVRNADPDTFAGDFDPEPLNLVLPFNNLDVRPNEVLRLDVAISKGKLKMGKAKLVPVQ
jgi:hypothetical protein